MVPHKPREARRNGHLGPPISREMGDTAMYSLTTITISLNERPEVTSVCRSIKNCDWQSSRLGCRLSNVGRRARRDDTPNNNLDVPSITARRDSIRAPPYSRRSLLRSGHDFCDMYSVGLHSGCSKINCSKSQQSTNTGRRLLGTHCSGKHTDFQSCRILLATIADKVSFVQFLLTGQMIVGLIGEMLCLCSPLTLIR